MALIPLKVDVVAVKIAERLGYQASPSPKIIQTVEEAVIRARGLLFPRGMYVEKKIIRFSGKDISIEGGTRFATRKIGRYLARCCDRVAVFLVTIGGELEKEESRLMARGDVLSALALDAIGSEAAERAADLLENIIRSSQGAGRGATPRFSPGYCDWAMTDQSLIFGLIDHPKIGIELNKNCMMSPVKSISGIIGLGKMERIAAEPAPCQICRQEDCPYRRAGFQGTKG